MVVNFGWRKGGTKSLTWKLLQTFDGDFDGIDFFKKEMGGLIKEKLDYRLTWTCKLFC